MYDVYPYGGGKIGLGSLTIKELYEIGVQQVSGSNSVVHVFTKMGGDCYYKW